MIAVENIVEYEPLAKHTSWRIGGPARYYTEAASPDALRAALAWGHTQDLPIFLLGGGTNLLVRDSGFPGLVIRYTARTWNIATQGNTGLLYAEAGAPMAGTVRRVCAQGWGGLEWAEGLPGTIGGAVYGNAGCYGGDIAGVLQRAWLLVDDDVQLWAAEQLQYGYRTSVLKAAQHNRDDGLSTVAPTVLAAEFRLLRADAAELADKMARIAEQRKSKTPWGSSCGSVFKNPPAIEAPDVADATDRRPVLSSGQLLDQAGLKGTRIGAAEISQKHANYIVNLGGASSDDVLRLIDLARSTVLREYGIELELEIHVL